MQKKLRIGTRGSLLARAQTTKVGEILKRDWLEKQGFPLEIELIPIKTSGDLLQEKDLSQYGGKGLFTKELEQALLKDEIDVAVHSMKDVATTLPEGLVMACILEREDPRDVFISKKWKTFHDLPKGAVVGSSSLRRKALALHQRPDLQLINFRGNVDTRLKKIEDGVAEGTFLALAGLKRLNLENTATEILPLSFMLPAVAQGAIGVECREDNVPLIEMLREVNHRESEICIKAERAFLKTISGSCTTPVAAYARIEKETLLLEALVASSDGRNLEKRSRQTLLNEGERIAEEIGEELKPFLIEWEKCASS